MVCIRCQKRPAIIFIQRMENGQMKQEGYCLHCARELHIKPVDASRYLPPFTVMWYSPHSRMAESTASGMESFSAQEKSTIKMEMARVTLRVKA